MRLQTTTQQQQQQQQQQQTYRGQVVSLLFTIHIDV